jgi:hypothetical protein
LGHLVRLHRAYKDRAAFLLIAVKDAGHPDPGSPVAGDPDVGATDLPARKRLVRKGLASYGVSFPALLDEDGEVERAYDGSPKRLVIVGADGRVAYDGGRGTGGGPSAWDLEEVEAHLRSALNAGPVSAPSP